jgi:hypothetical protein
MTWMIGEQARNIAVSKKTEIIAKKKKKNDG